MATTSTKGAKALRADVRRTLDRMGIPFREIPGGFECAHEPSIAVGGSNKARPLRKKTSKLSIVPKRKPTLDLAPPTPTPKKMDDKEKGLPDRPHDASASSSLVHLAAAARDAVEADAAKEKARKEKERTPSPVAIKVAPATPIKRDFAPQSPPSSFTQQSSPLGVRFEIHIVKVRPRAALRVPR